VRSETLLRLNRLLPTRLKYAGALLADVLGARHLILRFDPIIACNLRCGMCYFSDEKYLPPGPVRRFSKDDIERLAEMFFPLALQLHVGCGTEPTMFKGYPDIVKLARRYKVPFVGFTTNGQLLTDTALRTMIEAGLTEITLSTHGITKETYERLMQGASFEKYHETLKRIADLKRELRVAHPRIRINYTVNTSNLEELRDFFNRFDEYGISVLQIRPMAELGNTAYHWDDVSAVASQYNEVVAGLTEQCRARGIRLLANVLDPGYKEANAYATIYETAMLRYISPNIVWRDGFDFRTTRYRQYQGQIGYRRELLRYAIRGDRSLRRATRHASSQVLT
jgi:molybdenum cofactor biosynthesis enzyme MoaA